MNRKSVILLIGFLALISDAWILDLERAQRTIEKIDREETMEKGKGYGIINYWLSNFQKRDRKLDRFLAKKKKNLKKIIVFYKLT